MIKTRFRTELMHQANVFRHKKKKKFNTGFPKIKIIICNYPEVFALDDRKGGLYVSPGGYGVNNTPMYTMMALPKRAD